MNELDDLIKSMPSQISICDRFNTNGRKLKPIIYDLIIFRYRNEVSYRRLKISCTGNVILNNKLTGFYDGGLIDNVKKMISFLKDNGYMVQE